MFWEKKGLERVCMSVRPSVRPSVCVCGRRLSTHVVLVDIAIVALPGRTLSNRISTSVNPVCLADGSRTSGDCEQELPNQREKRTDGKLVVSKYASVRIAGFERTSEHFSPVRMFSKYSLVTVLNVIVSLFVSWNKLFDIMIHQPGLLRYRFLYESKGLWTQASLL